jgi:hypothetical protein
LIVERLIDPLEDGGLAVLFPELEFIGGNR